MPPKRPILGSRRQLNLDIKRVGGEYERLLASRDALDGKVPEKPRRVSQDKVAADLDEHPNSSYLEIAERLKASPINIAQHLSRGVKSGRFTKTEGAGQKSGRFSNTDDGSSAKG
jgi:hypothetical protein